MENRVQIRELPMRLVFDLKGSVEDVRDAAGFESGRSALDLLGDTEDVRRAAGFVPMPSSVNTRQELDDLAIHWVGPEWWLLTGPLGRERELTARLRKYRDKTDLLALNVSDLYSFVEISGKGTGDVLSSATSLDRRRIGNDTSTFTEVFGQRSLLIMKKETCELAFENSLKEYMLLRLGDYASESGEQLR